MLLERLIVHRPHPWGLLITFIELIKNPRYEFWEQPFTRIAPEIERCVLKLCLLQYVQSARARLLCADCLRVWRGAACLHKAWTVLTARTRTLVITSKWWAQGAAELRSSSLAGIVEHTCT